MENIRSITERIRSCISCGESQCPFIKERLDSHVTSHHFAVKRSFSSQQITPHEKWTKVVYTSRTNISSLKSNEHTSTSDLIDFKVPEVVEDSVNDKEQEHWLLRKIILECLENITQNQEPSDDIQNIINEFIDKINKPSLDYTDEYCDKKLDAAIDEFIASLPVSINKEDGTTNNLKAKIATRIADLKRNITPYSTKQNKNKLNDKKYYLTHKYTSTDFIDHDHDMRNANVQNNEVNVLVSSLSDNDTALCLPFDQNNKLVDTQTPNDITNKTFCKHIKIQTALDKHNIRDSESIYDANEANFKKIMKEWLLQINYEANVNISYSNIQFVLEELYNRLLPVLNTKSEILDARLELQEEVINFLNEYFNIVITKTSIAQLNKCAENLAISLLIEKSNNEIAYLKQQNKYSISNCKNIGINEEFDTIKPLLNDIVIENLDKYYSHYKSALIVKEVRELLLQNLHLIQRHDDYELKVKLLRLLKYLTDLPDISITDISNDIITGIKSITAADILSQNYSAFTDSKDKYRFGKFVSIYKSETELHDRSNNVSINSKRKSSIVRKKTTSKIDTDVQMYTEKLSNLIMAWINTLPPQNKNKSKRMKETLGTKLVEDILDQVKLEQVAPETSMEKDKYLSFFINRWLHRYEYFDKISEARPFVEQLMEKLKDIPVPNSLRPQKYEENEIPGISFIESPASVRQHHPPSQATNELSNEISHWVKEQPSQIFLRSIKSVTTDLSYKASKLQGQITSTSSEQITNEIKGWLDEVLKPDHKQKITALAETLKKRIYILIFNRDIDDIREKNKSKQINESLCCDRNISDIVNFEKTAEELIEKYLEHKYDSENFIAREACTQLVKRELFKLGALSKLDPNMSADTTEHETTIAVLTKELQYIKIISDCLRKLPRQESFSNTGNYIKADQVNILAKIIHDIDENKAKLPPENDYNYHLTFVVSDFFEKLHLPSHYDNIMPVLVNDLVTKIIAVQQLSSCCKRTLQNTFSSTGVLDLTLSDYIEAYIRENDEEIFEDDLKLEACVMRLFSEVNRLTNKASSACRTSCVPSNTSNKPDETIAHFTLEMVYANEITSWLSNLPLLPLRDEDSQNQLIFMITTLAEKMSKNNRFTNTNLNTSANNEVIDYVSSWITKLPLDPKKEIAFIVVIQQLINRIKRISNKDTRQRIQKQNVTSNLKDLTASICKHPTTCSNKANLARVHRDPGTVIVETIEEWCNKLPIKATNENTSNTLKQNVATKLYQRMGELNMNPEYFNNNILYEEMLSEEIDFQLQNLPQNNKLQNSKTKLKKELLDTIITLRNEIKNKTTGVEYKHDLEKTIEMSMPFPVRPGAQREDSPGFKIYKDRLTTMFILENFDHGNDAVKLNYEKRIRKEIDKYFNEAQDKYSVPLTKDQIYNDLYSALFNVPLPNESSMIDEVEEIKTRCEIDKWFETLPLREATGLGELLTWDQILSMLAKRLHEFEKYDKDCDDKIHKEITKWLVKLPLLPHQANNVDDFANDLQRRLKTTLSDRKHIPRGFNKSQMSEIDQSRSNLNSNEIDKSSNAQLSQPSSLSSCCRTASVQKRKKPADIILEIVESWCYQLPLPANTPQEKDNIKVIKDNLIVKIIMKISEINTKPEAYDDDFLYDTLLDVELENLMSKLPVSYELIQSKNSRKNQLKAALISVKPLIMEEKARYLYKTEVKNTIDKILVDPLDKDAENKILIDSLKEEIADQFIIYNFHKNDDDSGWKHRTILNDSVEKYFTLLDTGDEDSHMNRDPLLKGNQLLCELARIPTPGENAILEEIQEIQIKSELTKLFNDLSLTKGKENLSHINQIKQSLAKQLNDIIQEGNTCGNYRKLKECVITTLKKLNENIDLQIVDQFLKRLKQCINNISNSSLSYQHTGEPNQISHNHISSEKDKEYQWFSLLPETPQSSKIHHYNYNESLKFNEPKNRSFEINQEERHKPDNRFNNSGKGYEDFVKGSYLSSSMKIDDSQDKTKPYGKFTGMNSNQDVPASSSSPGKTPTTQNQSNTSFAQTVSTIPSKPHTSARSEQQQRYSPLERTFDHQSAAQGTSKRVNETQQTQMNEFHQNQANFSKSIPEPRQSGRSFKHQFSQSKSSVMPQTLNEIKFEHPPNSAKSIQSDRIFTNTDVVRGSGYIQLPREQQISRGLTPYRDMEEPSSFIPSMHPSIAQRPTAYSKVRGQSYRRPSITFSPKESPGSDEREQTSQTRCTSNEHLSDENLDVACDCLNKKMRTTVCSAHKQRHCRLCNGINPIYCRIPPFRYPSFYYH